MENVFEPMNFAGDVFEPTANFGGLKSKSHRRVNALEKLKNILKSNRLTDAQKQKVALAVSTGGVFAGLYLVSRLLNNKKSKFEGEDNFAGDVFEPMNFAGDVFEPMNFAGKKKSVKKSPVSASKPLPAPAIETPANKTEAPATTPDIVSETPADEKAEPTKKIFGMPKKVVLGAGIGLVVIGVASFFLLRKKK
jgi:hypothetical protein